MLKITFGDINNATFSIEAYFRSQYSSQYRWGEDKFIQEMIEDIDKCKHVTGDIFQHEILGLRTMEQLSGGVKNLILMYKQPTEDIYRGTNCGINCAKWIERIASAQDIHITLSYGMHLDPENIDGGVYCTNENRFLKDKNDFSLALAFHQRETWGFDWGTQMD